MAKQPKKRKRITTKFVQATENLPPPQLPNAIPAPDIDVDGFGDDGLSLRQRMFVDAIIGPAGGIASRAAKMAGYASDNEKSLGVTATRLLGNARIQEAIAHAYAKKRMTPEWAKHAAADLANASMANFLTVGDDGKPVFDWLKAASAGAIGHIREYKEDGIDGPEGPAIIKRSFKLFDKQRAIETILKLHGLLTEKHDITTGGQPLYKALTGVSQADL